DAVADDVVDRGAHRLGKTAVADVGRDRALHVDDVVVADAVELLGGHARLHVRGNDLEHLGGHAAGNAHLLDLFGGLEGDSHPRIIAHRGLLLHAAGGRRKIRRLRECAPPTPGVTGEYTPAALPRAGVPPRGGSATEAAGRPNPGTIARRPRPRQPPHPIWRPVPLPGVKQCPRSPCARCWKPASTSATRPATGTRRWARTSSVPAARSTSSTSRRRFRCSTTR